jgi:hypothetical protein
VREYTHTYWIVILLFLRSKKIFFLVHLLFDNCLGMSLSFHYAFTYKNDITTLKKLFKSSQGFFGYFTFLYTVKL